MSRGLNVFVNIGAKVGSSVGSATRATVTNFERMGRRIKVIAAETKASLAGMEEAQNRRWAVLARGAVAAYATGRALKPFVTFEDRLVRLGNTAEVHGARLDAAGTDIIRVGARFGTGASAAAEGVNDFVAAGLALDTSVKALAPTLKLAKTSGIEITEASQAGISVMQNLGVEVGHVGRAFDIMAKAGKLGRFELNDMAKAFPGLASRAKLLGMSGTDGVARLAAMLQPIREGARDADEAANNLLNLFDKLTGKETSDYFGKMGVSIPAVFAKAKRDGRDFVDAMLDETARLTKGGTDAFALSKLFPDRQARQAMLLLLQNRPKVDTIRRQSLNSRGTLDADFERISRTSKFGLDRTVAGLERVGIALGKAFGPALGNMAERFAVFAERFAGWAEAPGRHQDHRLARGGDARPPHGWRGRGAHVRRPLRAAGTLRRREAGGRHLGPALLRRRQGRAAHPVHAGGGRRPRRAWAGTLGRIGSAGAVAHPRTHHGVRHAEQPRGLGRDPRGCGAGACLLLPG